MPLVFVFDEYFAGNYIQHIKGDGIRPSPIAEYLIESGLYDDQIRCITISDIGCYPGKTEQDLLIYPVGLFQQYDHVLMAALLSPEPVNQTLQAKFASLSKIDRLYLMLDFSAELAWASHLDALPKLVDLTGFPMSRLIYLSSHPRVHMMRTFGYKYGATILGIGCADYHMHHWHKQKFEKYRERARIKRSSPLESLSHCRTYLCLNRRMRHHRLLTAAYLHRHGFLPSGFVSFGGAVVEPEVDRFTNKIVREAKLMISGSALQGVLEPADIDRFLQLGPLTLDKDFGDASMKHFSPFNFMLNESMDEFYNNSLFSIVPETWFGTDNSDSFLTEKTFKPIMAGHPVIVVGAPGILGDLRDLGYRTFDPIFDESYDEICDPPKRFAAVARAIAGAIHGVSRNPDTILPALFEIAEHNQENFISGTPTRIRAFLRHLEDEVRRSSRYAFSGIITQTTCLDAAGDVQGEVIQVDDRNYCRIIAGASPYVSFGKGFHAYEQFGQGRWMGKHGTLTLRLGVGRWEIILTSGPGTGTRRPKMTANGQELQPVWTELDGRDQALIEVSLDKPVLTLRFEAPWATIPAGQNRELGIWLFDDVLLGPARAPGEATHRNDRLSRALECCPERGEAIEQLDEYAYLSIKPSTSPHVSFLRGFFGHETDGRWCGLSGEMVLTLSPGSWDIVLQFHTRSAPWIFAGEMPIETSWVPDPVGRLLARIRVTATDSPTVLSFHSRNAFMPAEISQESNDRRVLGFWLVDRLLIRPEATGGRTSEN